MNRFFIVVLACLATGASGSLFSRGANFDGLNDILAEKEDINAIRSKLSSLSGSTKEAAELAIRVVDSFQCDSKILSTLAKIKQSNLDLIGRKPVEKFLRPHLAKVADTCGYEYEQIVARVDGKLAQQISNVHGFDPAYIRNYYQGTQIPQYYPRDIVHTLVRDLAKADPNAQLKKEINDETGERDEKVHRANTAYAFDEYVIKPCKKYTSAYKDIFETIETFAHFSDINDFYKKRSSDFRDKSLAYVVCRDMINESSEYKKAALNYNVYIN